MTTTGCIGRVCDVPYTGLYMSELPTSGCSGRHIAHEGKYIEMGTGARSEGQYTTILCKLRSDIDFNPEDALLTFDWK